MKISVWEGGRLREASVSDLKANFNRSTWIDLTDPTVEDLEMVAEALEVPRHILIGKLRSNYPHADTYPEYTKIFAWYLSPIPEGRDFSFHMSPVVVFANRLSAITISHLRTGIRERIAKEVAERTLAHLSIPARIIYITLTHLLESCENFAGKFERLTEEFEEAVPPWPRRFYAKSFSIRKEASRLLRLLTHFRSLTESLAKGRVHIPFTDEEKRALDTVYDRAIGAEEITETSLETIRDLIDMHLDTVSYDMNRAMRLMAAITCIVAIPSVIGALLGMNLIDVPWPWQLWQVALIGFSVAGLLAVYFYRKGWLGVT